MFIHPTRWLVPAMMMVISAPAIFAADPGNQKPSGVAAAVPVEFSAERAYAVSQRAIGGRLSNHRFTDSSGNPVQLEDLLGRPLVISMIYTSCHHICPTLTTHLAEVVNIARDALGKDAFTVLSVGFDSAVDQPRQMAMYAARRGIHAPGWHFLSAGESTVAALSDELGFIFQASPRGFDHVTQTTLADGEGVIRNQIYGVNFEPPLLIEALKHTLRGEVMNSNTVAGWWRNIKLLCTVYDPATGRYHFDYSLIIAVVMGSLCLIGVGVFILRSWRTTRRYGVSG